MDINLNDIISDQSQNKEKETPEWKKYLLIGSVITIFLILLTIIIILIVISGDNKEKEKEKNIIDTYTGEKMTQDSNTQEKITIKDSDNNASLKDYQKEELIILKQLYLEDYFFFNKCFACVFGGRHPVTKKFNKNVYMIDPIKGIIKPIINFDEFIKDDMVILKSNVGILNKFVDFLFIYHLINDSSCLKIIIIRKEIIENDICLNSKLTVVLNKNICNIVD
jgi:hypothetical protein